MKAIKTEKEQLQTQIPMPIQHQFCHQNNNRSLSMPVRNFI